MASIRARHFSISPFEYCDSYQQVDWAGALTCLDAAHNRI